MSLLFSYKDREEDIQVKIESFIEGGRLYVCTSKLISESVQAELESIYKFGKSYLKLPITVQRDRSRDQ